MNGPFSILITGLDASEENFALSHFSRSGHRVTATDNLADALSELRKNRIDLMYLKVSDADDPENRLQKVSAGKPALPVVVVCDTLSADFVLQVWRSGAADIISPPFTDLSLDSSLYRSTKRLTVSDPNVTGPVTARLFYLDEAGKECRVDITPPKFRIGRSSSNDLVVSHMGASRFHAEVTAEDGEYVLHDLGSKMGTYVNGIKIDRISLKNGDRIQLGGQQSRSFSFHDGDLLQTLLSRSDTGADIGLSLHGFKDVGRLFAAFRALSSTPVLDDVLALVLDTAIELTGAERGFIMLKEQGDALSFRCARNNNHQPLEGSCFQTSLRVPEEVFRTAKPVAINDLAVEGENQSHEYTYQLGLRSICCVPLRYIAMRESGGASMVTSAETIGVLYVDSSTRGAGASDRRIDALETLASEAAMAIYNARLYKDSQDKRRMEEQLEVAREIQQTLLPKPEKNLGYVVACSHNIPCHQIGGDFFDYFDLSDNRFGFALGDVAGKGMPAALLASMLQGAFSAQNLSSIPLPELIGHVNHKLALRSPGNRFVTFFFGILDAAGNCTYVNAGHNPPILLTGDGKLEELKEGGMVLGLFAEAQYVSGSVRMQPGDHLVLFTDGIIEAMNPSEEEFGMDRLTELLRKNVRSSAPEIMTRIREAVLSFSARAPQHDDITLMVLTYSGDSHQCP